jgi:Ca2+-binding EF-hand superfamily protein
MFLDVERTRFTKRIFSIFDDDKSGEIDFREFVLSIWNYCTLGKTSLSKLSIDIYITVNNTSFYVTKIDFVFVFCSCICL